MVFDMGVLLGRLDGDVTLAREFLTLFMANVPESVDSMREAVRLKNYKLLRMNAHSIKSSARLFGAHDLAEASQLLEQAAAKADEGRVAELLANFLTVLDKFGVLLNEQGYLA
ncbi:MAG: Hpt domain-containing protein [Desulfovibrionaceae bacterium]